MSGGFCEDHGPFDAPHVVCPYCVREGRIPMPPAGVPALDAPNFGVPQDSPRAVKHPVNIIPPEDGDDERTTSDSDPLYDVSHSDIVLFLLAKTPLKSRGRVFRVLPGQVIGRKDADVLINDKRISRQHARINAETQNDRTRLVIYDFGTPNGTFINGERVLGRMMVQENDEIQMGEHLFVLKIHTRT